MPKSPLTFSFCTCPDLVKDNGSYIVQFNYDMGAEVDIATPNTNA